MSNENKFISRFFVSVFKEESQKLKCAFMMKRQIILVNKEAIADYPSSEITKRVILLDLIRNKCDICVHKAFRTSDLLLCCNLLGSLN